eukprot:531645_1
MADSSQATTSIFEEPTDSVSTDAPKADLEPTQSTKPTEPASTKEEQPKPEITEPSQPSQPTEQTMNNIITNESVDEEKFAPNSIGDAKEKYLKNKHREAHKYPSGSPRKKEKGQQILSQVTKKITDTVDEYKEKISHQIDDTTSKLLNASDDVVAALSQ